MSKPQRNIEQSDDADIDSGTISIEGDLIIYHNEDVVFHQLKLSDIVIVGEMTNSNGPWFDDWFLVFVTRDGQWSKIPIYARNMDKLQSLLGTTFDSSLEATVLANSTNWKAVVRFPKSLEGKELFTLNYNNKQIGPKVGFSVCSSIWE